MRFLKPVAVVGVLAAAGAGGYATRGRWLPLLKPADPPEAVEPAEVVAPTGKVIVNEQAQQNLGLTAKPLKPQTFWKTIPVPGMVADRPGQSDRSIVAPVTGVVVKIARLPGEAVRPGEEVFVLRVLSESLHLTQTELFKATQDIALAQDLQRRLTAVGGGVSSRELAEANGQIARFQAAVNAYRQELQSRGLSPEQIDAVTAGRFVREVPVHAPARPPEPDPPPSAARPPVEVQELKVELGQQVQAGQTLCLLANHQLLAVEGRAFRDETPLLERSVQERWPVEVDFQETPAAGWGPVRQTFHIRYLANTIDPQDRTFTFRLPLENESRVVADGGLTQTLWRYRPGQRVRLIVRAERLDDVFVLPADAVARDGPEAFVFTQNVNTFERKPVRVLLQDRQQVVVANDGSLVAGSYAVQGGAAQLNRLVKAGGGSGVPKGYHVHADGSLHKNEDEGK